VLSARTEPFSVTTMEDEQSSLRPQSVVPSVQRKPLASAVSAKAPPDYTFDGTELPKRDLPGAEQPEESKRRRWPKLKLRRLTWPKFTLLECACQTYPWGPEVACLLFAIANLGAIVIVLSLRKDKVLPDWPSLLGINTLISIFSSLFKVGLLFCATECLGESKWIWFRRPNMLSDVDRFEPASLGALVSIVAIAVDPFSQQVLRFYTCSITDASQTAFISRSNIYVAPGSAYDQLDQTLTGVLYQGMLLPYPNETAGVPVYCPSGNCAFPHTEGVAYSSLAVCSSIEDITKSVSSHGTPVSGYNGTWNFSLPSGLRISQPYLFGTASKLPPISTLGNQIPFDPALPLYEFEILTGSDICAGGSDIAGAPVRDCVIQPFAARVFLHPCVISYGNVSIANSVFQEAVHSVGALNSTYWGYYAIGNYSSYPGVDCSGSKTPMGRKRQPTAMVNVEGRFTRIADPSLANNDILASTHAWDRLYYDPTCIFILYMTTQVGLENGLVVLFGADASSPNQLEVSGSTLFGDAWLRAFWGSDGRITIDGISKTIDGLTTSINNVLRGTGGDSNSIPLRGTVIVNATCVGVVWAWLALPIGLTAMTLCLLIATMILSGQRHQNRAVGPSKRPWKSSSLPLLWCGVQDSLRERYGRLDETAQMKKRGDEVKVALRLQDRFKPDLSAQEDLLWMGWVLKECGTKDLPC
jgi:hypothetical protein